MIGFEKVAKILIEKGANVNVVNEDNESPLLMAALYSKTHSSTNLCSSKFRWEIQISANTSSIVLYYTFSLILSVWPILIYSFLESEKILQMLVENGANINAADRENNTALIFATKKGTLFILIHIQFYGI